MILTGIRLIKTIILRINVLSPLRLHAPGSAVYSGYTKIFVLGGNILYVIFTISAEEISDRTGILR